ncbi:MAG: hypothetical protein IKQ91_05870 [Oscillospiraceae bacterium]|nr:hypothetical protein [Oscillospiraceae bacterium]
MKTLLTVCADLLCGLAVSALSVLFCAVVFSALGGYGDSYYYAAGAVLFYLIAAVKLLRTPRRSGRIIRGLTALCGFLPLLRLDLTYGFDLTEWLFEWVNPAYGGVEIGDGIMLIVIVIPATFLITLTAILIARRPFRRKKAKRIPQTADLQRTAS